MYLVISQWEALPGQEAQFDKLGRKVGAVLRKQPGVVLLETIKVGKRHISVHGYRDEATYHALVDDPKGAFAKALASLNVDKVGRWISSERGETMAHEA